MNKPRALTTKEEHEILCKYAKEKMVLEIGSYDGASAIAMSRVARAVHCVDPFREDEGTLGKIGPSAFRFINATEEIKNIVLHKGRSIDVLPLFRDDKFGFVFVDGSHAYKNARLDIGFAIALLGGVIRARGLHKGEREHGCFAVHDWEWPSVNEALMDYKHHFEIIEQYAGRLVVCRLI